MREFTVERPVRYTFAPDGDVAQLGERRVRNAEVGSSILLVSTTSQPANPLLHRRVCCF